MTHKCTNCLNDFNRKPSKILVGKNNFCCRKCYIEYKTGKRMKNFKGKYISSCGYVLIYKPKHHESNRDGWISEHRYIMEKHIGRKIKPSPNEIVHHINGDKTDNRIENLELLSQGEHASRHMRKLSKKDIVDILNKHKLIRSKSHFPETAKKYGISESYLEHIVYGVAKYWKEFIKKLK